MLNDRYTEHVRGTIIGEVMQPGGLFYDGRRQGPIFWAVDDEGLKAKAEAHLAEIKSESGQVYRLIYPDPNKWELRIFA